METPHTPDVVNRGLAHIQDELSRLEQGELQARYELQKERDLVRDSVDPDTGRNTGGRLAELAAREKALEQVQDSMVNSAGMSGAAGPKPARMKARPTASG